MRFALQLHVISLVALLVTQSCSCESDPVFDADVSVNVDALGMDTQLDADDSSPEDTQPDAELPTAAGAPRLYFTDVTSGPNTGNGDGVGSGAIVTLWGYGHGNTQGTSTIKVGNVEATAVYYWKNADGSLPGGPADLSTYHKMQEVAFAIPEAAAEGETTIQLVVNGDDSNSLPFRVRDGRIRFVSADGDDSNDGSWASPWATLESVTAGTSASAVPGDVIYSIGVGQDGDVNIGRSAGFESSAQMPMALIAYPGYQPEVTASNSAFRNWNNLNSDWRFSKWRITTTYQGVSLFARSRIIGNYVTGPELPDDGIFSGWIGGNCLDGQNANVENCGGHRILGNEVEKYGRPDGSSFRQHHLTYISNRSGMTAPEGYEFGWNHFHDNPVHQGIHVYDQNGCGGWGTPLLIHDNVIKNNGGNSINLATICLEGNTSTYVWNNLTITDIDYNVPLNGTPLAAIRIDDRSSKVWVWNNTFMGWGEPGKLRKGTAEFSNNIMIGNRGLDFLYSGDPEVSGNNLFFDPTAPDLVPPTWATESTSPQLGAGFIPGPGAAIGTGTVPPTYAERDFHGVLRESPFDLGALNSAAP